MTTQCLMIPVTAGVELEAQVDGGSQTQSAIVCHPHPLYGGSMDNNVVAALCKAFHNEGWATVRFNFRGVGRSTGVYGNGDGETEDLLAVSRYLQSGQRRITRLAVAGYSFGAWIALRAIEHKLHVAPFILVSPPVDLFDFGKLRLPDTSCLVLCGDQDDFCALQSLRNWLASRSGPTDRRSVEVISGADHFYWGHESDLQQKVSDFLKRTE